jgi:hypothetical protein
MTQAEKQDRAPSGCFFRSQFGAKLESTLTGRPTFSRIKSIGPFWTLATLAQQLLALKFKKGVSYGCAHFVPFPSDPP